MLPLGWGIVYTLAYTLLDVPFYHWYVLPPVYGLIILSALGLDLLLRQGTSVVQRFMPLWYPHMRTGLSGIALLAGMFMLPIITSIAQVNSAHTQVRYQTHTKLSQWFNRHAPADASIGYVEVGYLGYLTQRPIIDSLGLVTPGVAPAIARRDFAWAYEQYRPDYIIIHAHFFPESMQAMRDSAWFQAEYMQVAQFTINDQPFTIFKREARE